MIPLVVLLEAADEVFGGLVVLAGREHQERVRLLARDGVEIRGHIPLTLEVISSAGDELTLRVIVLIRHRRVVIERISVPENRGGNIYRRLVLRAYPRPLPERRGVNRFLVTRRARERKERACKQQNKKIVARRI